MPSLMCDWDVSWTPDAIPGHSRWANAAMSHALFHFDPQREPLKSLSLGTSELPCSLEQVAIIISGRLEQALNPDREAIALANAWDKYRRSLAVPDGPLPASRAAQLETMWAAINQNIIFIPAPRAALAEDGTFVMSWNRGSHHFEIEMLEDGTFEWFYMERSTPIREGEEGLPVGVVSPLMRDCLARAFEPWRR